VLAAVLLACGIAWALGCTDWQPRASAAHSAAPPPAQQSFTSGPFRIADVGSYALSGEFHEEADSPATLADGTVVRAFHFSGNGTCRFQWEDHSEQWNTSADVYVYVFYDSSGNVTRVAIDSGGPL
jgi:hypothetical protein